MVRGQRLSAAGLPGAPDRFYEDFPVSEGFKKRLRASVGLRKSSVSGLE